MVLFDGLAERVPKAFDAGGDADAVAARHDVRSHARVSGRAARAAARRTRVTRVRQ